MEPTAQQASDILKSLQGTIGNIAHHDVQVSKDAQEKALEAARRLVQALATPEQTILHHAFDVGRT